MAEWQYTTTTVADMQAAFPYQTLPPINGKPTLHTLLQSLKLLCTCSQKIKSGLGPLGYLFVTYLHNITTASLMFHLSFQDQHHNSQHIHRELTPATEKI